MAAEDSTGHVIQSLVTNAIIAVAKGVAAFVTGSAAMLAETIHSAADCTNQLLLLLGVTRAKKAPDEAHPLGYGRALYFYSFIVALFLFTGGGVFSAYEGVHKIMHPEKPDNLVWAFGVLGFSLALEGWATISNVRELNKRRGDVSFFRYLRESKDSDLVVVFGENSAATLGLAVAGLALVVVMVTGDPIFDGVGTLLIGIILIGVAIFLATEIKSLLVGEAADPAIARSARALAKEQQHFRELLSLITVQQGPGEVLLAAKVMLSEHITSDQAVEEINAFETALRARHPEVKWSFIEPDLPEGMVPTAGKAVGADVREAVLALAEKTPGVGAITQLAATHLSREAIMLGMKVRFEHGIRIEEVEAIVDNLEQRIRTSMPQMKRIWVEPDSDPESAVTDERQP